MRKSLGVRMALFVVLLAAPFTVFGAQEDIACSISATPTRAAPGEQVTLRWNSFNARSASLDGFGPVPLSGSKVVTASQTRDYKIFVSGYKNNYVGCIARISVTAKQPVCNISFVPLEVASNNFATLSWSTDYADSVYISGIGNVHPKGNQMVRAVGNTTYYLTARGAGGICERSAELSVREQYQSFGYFPQTIQNIANPLFGYSNNSTPRYNAPTVYPQQNSYRDYESYDSYWYEEYDDVYDARPYSEDSGYTQYWENPYSETSNVWQEAPSYQASQFGELSPEPVETIDI